MKRYNVSIVDYGFTPPRKRYYRTSGFFYWWDLELAEATTFRFQWFAYFVAWRRGGMVGIQNAATPRLTPIP